MELFEMMKVFYILVFHGGYTVSYIFVLCIYVCGYIYVFVKLQNFILKMGAFYNIHSIPQYSLIKKLIIGVIVYLLSR